MGSSGEVGASRGEMRGSSREVGVGMLGVLERPEAGGWAREVERRRERRRSGRMAVC